MCKPAKGLTKERRRDRRGPKKVVRFFTYNILSIRNRGLESVMRRLAQVQVDCGVLQETKLTDRVYTRESRGFLVIAKAALSAHRGSVAVLYCKLKHFSIKEFHLHILNVLRFQLVMGRRRWNFGGCYIPPRYASTIEEVATSIRNLPYRANNCIQTRYDGSDGHGYALPTTAQGVVEGEVPVEDVAVRTRDLVLDGLHSWNML